MQGRRFASQPETGQNRRRLTARSARFADLAEDFNVGLANDHFRRAPGHNPDRWINLCVFRVSVGWPTAFGTWLLLVKQQTGSTADSDCAQNNAGDNSRPYKSSSPR